MVFQLNPSVFGSINSKADYDRQKQELMRKRQAEDLQNQLIQVQMQKAQSDIAAGNSGANLPATIQIANEIQKAIDAGDFERANLLSQTHKMYDRGYIPYAGQQTNVMQVSPNEAMQMNPSGNQQLMPAPMPLPAPIGGAKAGYTDYLRQVEEAKKTGSLSAELQLKPEVAMQTAQSSEIGKERGVSQAKLESLEASLPNLQKMVSDLSDLGRKATYTYAGQARDAVMRQTGMPVGEGAVARTEYMAKVDNEVLPLLRQTFGAAFTVEEGKSLRATLGDPNKSPEEKDAILKAFIENKTAEIGTLQRRAGSPQSSVKNELTLEEFLSE